jgi:hypothetical protein
MKRIEEVLIELCACDTFISYLCVPKCRMLLALYLIKRIMHRRKLLRKLDALANINVLHQLHHHLRLLLRQIHHHSMSKWIL